MTEKRLFDCLFQQKLKLSLQMFLSVRLSLSLLHTYNTHFHSSLSQCCSPEARGNLWHFYGFSLRKRTPPAAFLSAALLSLIVLTSRPYFLPPQVSRPYFCTDAEKAQLWQTKSYLPSPFFYFGDFTVHQSGTTAAVEGNQVVHGISGVRYDCVLHFASPTCSNQVKRMLHRAQKCLVLIMSH